MATPMAIVRTPTVDDGECNGKINSLAYTVNVLERSISAVAAKPRVGKYYRLC